MNNKISVIGMGYVGIANALLLAKKHKVSVLDIDPQKVKDFNNKVLPIVDLFAQSYFEDEKLDISATTNLDESIKDASFIILALPTNFNEQKNEFDTQVIEEVVTRVVAANHNAIIVIKSTVNIGYTQSLKDKVNLTNIIFSPEFLREGHALEDNLNPSRVIIGGEDKASILYGDLVKSSLKNDTVPIMYMDSMAAESVKLFSNSYLAMRVSFFNELDSFCVDNHLNTHDIIRGVSLDKRIGDFYNNPSFGFGGYCLPKDLKQLLSRFKSTPHHLFQAIQDSNKTRAKFLADKIMDKGPKIVGVYKLAMKHGSDNYRESSIFNVINELISRDIIIKIYDPSIKTSEINGITLITDFNKFIEFSDLIIANRLEDDLKPFADKVFSRDIFSSDD
jgi:UDPglucose 6-dehydrogenase